MASTPKSTQSSDQYSTLAPVTPKGKWVILSRRVGSKERYAPLAETRDEGSADKIVLALNALQGKIDEIDAPLKPLVEDLRRSLSSANARIGELATKLRAAEDRTRQVERRNDELLHERNRAQRDLEEARRELRAAAQPKVPA